MAGSAGTLEFEPGYPVRVTSGAQNLHPAAVETTRGLLALVYTRDETVWRTFSLDRGETWAEGAGFVSRGMSYQPRARYNHRGGFALVFSGAGGSSARDVYFEEILEVQNVSDNLVSARIKRSSEASSKGCDVVISNPGSPGLYDPEVPNTKWSGVFQPGAPVELKAGYGGEVLTRFRGYIDSVAINDEEPVLSFSGRGEFKQLLDQSLGKKRYYQNKRRVAIIAELAGEAGIDPELVRIQDSPERVTAEYDREKTYESVMREQADALGFELLEPDEGGLVCREPSTSTTPAWYFEEEENMYSREREWDDDEVYTRVQVYREDKLRDDGSVELAGFTAETIVDTPFLTPAGKTLYEKADDDLTEAEGQKIADALAVRIGREGSRVEVASWLHPALEVGDTVSVRRKSLGVGQSGAYIVEALDDDLAESGFGAVLQARRMG